MSPYAGAAEQQIGANVPWVTYEAEQGKTTGSILGPDFAGHTPAREASGRECVKLAATGQFIEFTAKGDGQGLVVRYCIPDSADGRGIDATLGLYINGQSRAKLPMTSHYAYLYGDYPFNNQPSSGSPRHFWDEVRLMPGAIHAGDVIRLQKDADDSASEYLIDFVDLETVPAALEQPASSLSIAAFGAKGDGSADARPVFLAAIGAAKEQHKSVWIPAGRFVVKGPLDVSDIEIRGAGMWYSTLVGAADYAPENRLVIRGNGSRVTLADFAMLGNLNYRNDSEANDGLGGSFGTGSSVRNIWVEHTKTGAWLVNSDGLLVENCRFRDTIADGINLCIGMRNTVVRNCTSRGNGDDCFAMWPATYDPAKYEPGHNQFINCTAQLPSLAQGFSVYGGEGNSVHDCRAIDIPYGAGILVSTMFPTQFGFRGTTTFSGIDITRCGDNDGAIAVMTNLLDLGGVRIENVRAQDCPTDGIKFTCVQGRAIREAAFDHVSIENAGISGTGHGILAARGTVGSATMTDVAVLNAKDGECRNDSSAFRIVRGASGGAESTRDLSKELSKPDISAVLGASGGK
jgi:hypothetical protein